MPATVEKTFPLWDFVLFFFLNSIMDDVDAQRSETQRGVLQTEYFMPLHVLTVD